MMDVDGSFSYFIDIGGGKTALAARANDHEAILSLNWNPREHYKDVRVAQTYDQTRFSSLPGRIFDYLEKRALLRSLRGLPAGAEIVDIPCGTGRLAEALLDANYRVAGIDISAAMLDQAARRLARFGNRFRCEVGDATGLDTPKRPFEAALCARILMHFPLDQQIDFLRGVARQTNGPIVFNQSYSSGYQRVRRGLKKLLRHPAPAGFPLSEAEIAQLLARTGLQELRRYWVAPGVSEAFFLVARHKAASDPAAGGSEKAAAPVGA